MNIDPKRLAKFEAAKLVTGSHRLSEEEVGCAANWGNYLINGIGNDDKCPPCASPAIWRAIIRLNDRFDDEDRQKLKPFILRALGTANDSLEQKRRWIGTNYLVHEITPAWLERVGLAAEAAILRALPELTAQNHDEHLGVIRQAREAAWQKRSANRQVLRKKIEKALPADADADADAATYDACAGAYADAYADVDAACADAYACGDAADAAAVAAAAAAAVAAAVAAAAEPELVKVIHTARKSGKNVYDAVYSHLRPKFNALWQERLGAVYGDRTARAFELLNRLIDAKET